MKKYRFISIKLAKKAKKHLTKRQKGYIIEVVGERKTEKKRKEKQDEKRNKEI